MRHRTFRGAHADDDVVMGVQCFVDITAGLKGLGTGLAHLLAKVFVGGLLRF